MTSDYSQLLEETVEQFITGCINRNGENCQKLTANLKQEADLIFEAKKAENLDKSWIKCELVFQELRKKCLNFDAGEDWFDQLEEDYNTYSEELGPAKDMVFYEVV